MLKYSNALFTNKANRAHQKMQVVTKKNILWNLKSQEKVTISDTIFNEDEVIIYMFFFSTEINNLQFSFKNNLKILTKLDSDIQGDV